MAAAAYKATLIFKGGNGDILTRYVTADDVNGNYYTFQDGNTFLTLPSNTNWVWTDLILSAAGTDTSNAAVYVNGAASPLQIVNSANITSVQFRQIAQTMPRYPAGTTLKIKQAT